MHPSPTAADTPRLVWPTQALAQQLAPLLPGVQLQVVAQIGSTNTALLERVRHSVATPGEALPPMVLVAEVQHQGRGRQGKAWHSGPPGHALMCSLALPLQPRDWSGLSLAVGLALAEAIEPAPDNALPALALKWPNDLVLRDDAAHLGRKLGGILIETVPAGAQRWAVIGFGLNLQPAPPDPALPWGRACVHELHPGLDAPGLLARVLPPLVQAVKAFEQTGFAPLQARYARRDLLRGQPVQTTLPDVPAGVADGVDAQGMLWLRTERGRVAVGSGELSLRRAAPAAAPTEGRPC